MGNVGIITLFSVHRRELIRHARDAEVPQEHHDLPFEVWLGEEHVIGLEVAII